MSPETPVSKGWEMECPECSSELNGLSHRYSCKECGGVFDVVFTCQECGAKPEEVSGCGSVSYFCNSCNSLRSRTGMNKKFIPVETSGDTPA